jgi:hypothetical protein
LTHHRAQHASQQASKQRGPPPQPPVPCVGEAFVHADRPNSCTVAPVHRRTVAGGSGSIQVVNVVSSFVFKFTVIITVRCVGRTYLLVLAQLESTKRICNGSSGWAGRRVRTSTMPRRIQTSTNAELKNTGFLVAALLSWMVLLCQLRTSTMPRRIQTSTNAELKNTGFLVAALLSWMVLLCQLYDERVK